MTDQQPDEISLPEGDYQTQARRKKRYSNLAVAFALLVSFCLILFSIAIPEILHRSHITELRKRGAQVVTVFETPDPIEKLIGDRPAFRLHEKVLGVEFYQCPVADADLQAISYWPDLEFVAISHADISEQAILQLVSHCPQLRRLQIVSCQNIKPAFIHRIRDSYRSLEIGYRGVAYLGIAGKAHPRGCVIAFVDPGKPADKAGLRIGDIITSFNSKKVSSFEQLVDFIGECASGDEVTINLLRTERELSVQCTLTDWTGRLR